MRSLLHTAPTLLVKIIQEGTDQKERTIGYASGLTFQVSQGQKEIMVVDSPFPAEIAQAANQSMVRGAMSIFLPKGQNIESLGLVPHRVLNNNGNDAAMARSKYFHIRIYDRATSEMVLSADFVKVSNYTIAIQARGLVRCELQFSGLYLTPGNAR